MKVNVLITGPAGSGKTTLAAQIALFLNANGQPVTVRDEARPLENILGHKMLPSDYESFAKGGPREPNPVEIVVVEAMHPAPYR